jgi:hypothetical protein
MSVWIRVWRWCGRATGIPGCIDIYGEGEHFNSEIEFKPHQLRGSHPASFAFFNSMRDHCQPRLRDLDVVLRRIEARSDGADHLAFDDDGKPALHLGEALRGNGSNATVVDRVLERLTRFLEQRGRPDLAGR